VILEGYSRLGLEHPNAYRLVFCSTPRTAAAANTMRDATTEIASQCYACYAGVVREIAAEGRLRTPDVECAAQALWASCHGVVALMITRPNVDWAPAEQLISLTVEGLLHGLVTD
jgi:hypothetical protein